MSAQSSRGRRSGSKKKLPFDREGGVVVMPRRLLESRAYLSLSTHARCLLPILQIHWRNDSPVALGIREAAEKLGCNQRTAMKAFDELQRGGFIQLHDAAEFNSRTGSKARTWILTWMPYMDRKPTNNWEQINNSTYVCSATQI